MQKKKRGNISNQLCSVGVESKQPRFMIGTSLEKISNLNFQTLYLLCNKVAYIKAI